MLCQSAYPQWSTNCFDRTIEILPNGDASKELEMGDWLFDKVFKAYENTYKHEMGCKMYGQDANGKEIECWFFRYIEGMNLIETIYNSMYLTALLNNYNEANDIIENVLAFCGLYDKNDATAKLSRVELSKPVIEKLVQSEADVQFAKWVERKYSARKEEIIDYLKNCR